MLIADTDIFDCKELGARYWLPTSGRLLPARILFNYPDKSIRAGDDCSNLASRNLSIDAKTAYQYVKK